MDPSDLDSLLSMMALDDLDEALDVIRAWLDAGRLTDEAAAAWQERIEAWVHHRGAAD